MATWDDVRRVVSELPESVERTSKQGLLEWRVRNTLFAWERPLRKADIEALGGAPPDGPILAVRVAHEGAKEALLADDPGVYFTTPHFDGHLIVLVRLDRIGRAELAEVVAEAWMERAPRRLVDARFNGPG